MLKLPEDTRIYLALEPVNMHKSFDGLAILAQEVVQQNPLSGHLFVFHNKARDKVKMLIWNKNGFFIFYKRLEKYRFKFPKLKNSSHITITEQELELLLDGIDIMKLKRLPELEYGIVA
jgi:transposase